MFIRILAIFLLFLAICYLKYRINLESLFAEWAIIIFMILIIWCLPIYNVFKVGITIFLFSVYRNNLLFLSYIFRVVSKYRNNELGDTDKVVRDIVTTAFQKTFTFTHNFHLLPSIPTIIVANYVYDRIENISCIMIPKNLAIITGHAMLKSGMQHVVKKLVVKSDEKNGYEKIKEQVKESLEQGFSVFAYVTKIRRFLQSGNCVGSIRSGMFSIAKELNVPITPVAIDYVHSINGIITDQNYRICVGTTFYVSDLKEDMYKTRKFYREKIKEFIENKFT